MLSSETLPFYFGTEETHEAVCQNSRSSTEILNVELPNMNQAFYLLDREFRSIDVETW